MSIYKRGDVYWYKFMWSGQVVRKSTKQGNAKEARRQEDEHRTRLDDEQKEKEAACRRFACAAVIRCHECEKLFNAEKVIAEDNSVFCSEDCHSKWNKRRNPAPLLRDFLLKKFLPFAEKKHSQRPNTLRYYRQGVDMLLKSDNINGLRVDKISDEHAVGFAASRAELSPSGINRALRTLRRALKLAFEWGVIEKPAKITLVTGEVMRTHVLTEDEEAKYLSACPQPWRDCATMILDEGFRPGEVFALRWSHVLLNEDGSGLIQIVAGKSRAARRCLPTTPRVYALLQSRHEAAGRPEDGWIFPKTSDTAAHTTGDVCKDQHRKAVKLSGVREFPPYCLRHTALTRLSLKAGGNVFILATIAGHSTITVTQRYIHPQPEAIGQIFGTGLVVGTKVGTVRNLLKSDAAHEETTSHAN